MSIRKLKIYPKFRPSSGSAYGELVPEVRLCGQWLKRCGFGIGDHISVIVTDQEITIKRVGNGNL